MVRKGRKAYEITPALLKKVKRLAGNGLTDKQICQCIGWSVSTLCEKKKLYSEFSEAIATGRAEGLQTIANALFDAASKGNFQAQRFYLITRDNENWKEKTGLELGGVDGDPIKTDNTFTIKFVE